MSVWVGLPRDVGVGAGVCLFLLLCVKEVEFAVKEAEGRIARRQVVAEEAMNSILADLTSLRYTGKIKEPPHA